MSGKLAFAFSAALSIIFSLFVISYRLNFFSGDEIRPTVANVSRELILTGGDDDIRPPTELLPGELVNINTASKELLMLLPGIGEKLSEEIISYRLEHGEFVCIEDIMKIDGIGEGKFSAISNCITVKGGRDENTGG